MAKAFTTKIDFSASDKLFKALSGEMMQSLGRRMSVTGGVLLRDEAKRRALIADDKQKVERRGLWASTMYLAFDTDASTKNYIAYKVSWNRLIAKHGHLIEFGHWQPYKVYKAADGEWYTNKRAKLDVPMWVAPRPVLRPTFETRAQDALRAMMERGKDELPRLLREYVK